MSSGKLFIGGLSYSSTSDSLREYFSAHGEVEDAVVITDRETGNSRGFGFVTYTNEEDADKAIEQTNNTDLDGRTIRVDKASGNRREGPPSYGGGGRGGYGGRGGGGYGGDRRGGDRNGSYGGERRSGGGYGDRDRGDRNGGSGGYSRGGRSGGYDNERSSGNGGRYNNRDGGDNSGGY